MTIEEIFSKIISHMIEGINFHDKMAQVYGFLGLYGYEKCHEYHCFEEKQGYRKLYHYYSTHYFKLIKIDSISEIQLIPDTWYKYTTQEVDTSTKRTTLKELMNKWISWESTTKQLYSEMRKELTQLGELDTAIKIDSYIYDVSKELAHANKLLLDLETINYNMEVIVPNQEVLYHKYKKKLGW